MYDYVINLQSNAGEIWNSTLWAFHYGAVKHWEHALSISAAKWNWSWHIQNVICLNNCHHPRHAHFQTSKFLHRTAAHNIQKFRFIQK